MYINKKINISTYCLYLITSLPVCDDHEFKDEKLFFRFRRDDNTYEEPPDAMIVAKGQRIYSR